MTDTVDLDPERRVARLEKRLDRYRMVLLVLCLLAGSSALVAFGPGADDGEQTREILRARGLVIEDAEGRPRVLLGAPLPEVEGRPRDDSASGLLVLDESGTDRVAVGYPTNPRFRAGDRVGRRTSPAAGIGVYDSLGRERGGFGVMDDGRVNLGLDYPDREGVSLGIIPDWGVAGLMVWGRDEGNPQRVYLGANFDSTGVGPGGLYLNDPDGRHWVRLHREAGTPRMELVDPESGEVTLDVIERVRAGAERQR